MGQVNSFRGTGVAIVTPFDEKGNVDFPSLGNVIEHIIKGKCEYIVALGTTGESVTLTKDEKKSVAGFIKDKVNKRTGIVLGIGGNDTREVVNTFNQFDLSGWDAVLSVSPAYNKPNQRGIYEHYKAVSEASPLPVILYNVPGRTSSNITADTTLKLASDFKNIIATKEASGNLEQIMRIIKYRPKEFLVISGDDLITLPLIACGGDGVISVVANAFPGDFSEMTRKALAGNFDQARALHYKLTEVIAGLFIDGSPAGVKEVLAIMKICGHHVRLPLVRVNETVQGRLKEMVKTY